MLYVPAGQAVQLTAPPLELQLPSLPLRASVTVGPKYPGTHGHV